MKTLLAALAACVPFAAVAQDNPAARSLAASCAACHGSDGRSVTAEVPGLAGLPRDYIAAQMKAFQDGRRPATVMQQLAKGYSDQQIQLLADYFAGRSK